MSIANYFYNATTKRYIAVFGTMFNKISIARSNNDGDEIQRIIVPIAYGPYQKFLARIQQDPNLDRKTAIQLPRMSFEILSMNYDGQRKIGSLKRHRSSEVENSFQYSGSPWNIEFTLNIMVKYAEDAVQILEQIIPFFKPERTTTVEILSNIDPLDIPLVLNGVQMEDLYEADFVTRRAIMYTLNFTMKAWYFGPVRERSIIKFVDTRLYTNTTGENPLPDTVISVYPGLTEDGEPTTDPDNTIPWQDIERDDDWGVIELIETYNEEEHEE